MKHRIYAAAILIFIVMLISSNTITSARKLAAKGEGDVKSSNKSVVTMESTADFSKKVEECEDEDDEWLKRRGVAEAHLDYIYTQQHKP